jgi:predicted metal-binding protein
VGGSALSYVRHQRLVSSLTHHSSLASNYEQPDTRRTGGTGWSPSVATFQPRDQNRRTSMKLGISRSWDLAPSRGSNDAEHSFHDGRMVALRLCIAQLQSETKPTASSEIRSSINVQERPSKRKYAEVTTIDCMYVISRRCRTILCASPIFISVYVAHTRTQLWSILVCERSPPSSRTSVIRFAHSGRAHRSSSGSRRWSQE